MALLIQVTQARASSSSSPTNRYSAPLGNLVTKFYNHVITVIVLTSI